MTEELLQIARDLVGGTITELEAQKRILQALDVKVPEQREDVRYIPISLEAIAAIGKEWSEPMHVRIVDDGHPQLVDIQFKKPELPRIVPR